ncbi:uncharacterized protein LOC128998849 [Macrosteles quadrilineatus]|uniref:uncharacterized protein LOC128998849 n=1 Tax=Macrosteles quadrilineatus TaxID=74068 RepID=UPI0023E30172|nr:uncharacterized protein LOC128998849 [Macrosteles quadrilineatus]
MQHEYHPMFAQNLTPQQQQMYQQHMQLQHHAQHLKKIRRSLPNSSNLALESTLTQGQLQKQKKDLNVNVLGGASLGSSLGMQQVGSGGYLTQGVLLGNQLITIAIDTYSPCQNPPLATALDFYTFPV